MGFFKRDVLIMKVNIIFEKFYNDNNIFFNLEKIL